jgi:hypothetical protein
MFRRHFDAGKTFRHQPGDHMKLSQQTLTEVAKLITGGSPGESEERLSPYRSFSQLTDFFDDEELHPRSGAPSRLSYTKEKLQKLNGTDQLDRIICRALDFSEEDGLDPQHAGAHLNKFLKRDGYEMVQGQRHVRYEGNTSQTEPYFVVRPLRSATVPTPSLNKLSHESIMEQVQKARQKIDAGDPAGAITNACTLVEELLKHLLRETGTDFKGSEGDIRALYKRLAEPLHLSPKNESLESYLKSLLEALQRQISGLYELGNKAGDRHARIYNPAPHHARLAVNVAFTLCEFLLESYEYQQRRAEEAGRGGSGV